MLTQSLVPDLECLPLLLFEFTYLLKFEPGEVTCRATYADSQPGWVCTLSSIYAAYTQHLHSILQTLWEGENQNSNNT